MLELLEGSIPTNTRVADFCGWALAWIRSSMSESVMLVSMSNKVVEVMLARQG